MKLIRPIPLVLNGPKDGHRSCSAIDFYYLALKSFKAGHRYDLLKQFSHEVGVPLCVGFEGKPRDFHI